MVSLPFLLISSLKAETRPVKREIRTAGMREYPENSRRQIRQDGNATANIAAVPSHDLLGSAKGSLTLCLPNGLPIHAAAISPNPHAIHAAISIYGLFITPRQKAVKAA